MGGWVSEDEVSVYYPGTEPYQITPRWTPALGYGGGRFFGDLRDRAAFGNCQQCQMDSATVGCDVFEEMCKQGSGGAEEGKARLLATGARFC